MNPFLRPAFFQIWRLQVPKKKWFYIEKVQNFKWAREMVKIPFFLSCKIAENFWNDISSRFIISEICVECSVLMLRHPCTTEHENSLLFPCSFLCYLKKIPWTPKQWTRFTHSQNQNRPNLQNTSQYFWYMVQKC